MGLLLVLLVIMALSAAGALGSVWLIVRALQRRNRISLRTPTEAPLAWLWSPAASARIHRRLRAAASLARLVAQRDRSGSRTADVGRTAEMAHRLVHEAVALDDHLSLVGRLPGPERRRALPLVVAELRRIEQLASRLSMYHLDRNTEARLLEHATAIEQLATELDQLDQANEILDAVEAEAGLHRPNPRQGPATPTYRPSTRAARDSATSRSSAAAAPPPSIDDRAATMPPS